MLETFRKLWKIKDLQKKVLYTFLMLLIYRLVGVIPAPGIDVSRLNESNNFMQLPLLNMMQMMTGNAFGQMTIMAMGITPYINSSIIMQLLCVAIPKLEEMQKEGEEGQKKIAQITRYVTVVLGFIQAIALTVSMKANGTHGFLGLMTIGFCLAAGTAMAMWIGERITENGIGNGISMLIFAGIVSNLVTGLTQYLSSLFTAFAAKTLVQLLASVLVFLILLLGIVFVDLAERRIPVQYSKRMVGRKMYGGQSTHIPLKLNASGVLPLIFASSIMQFPGTILAFFSNSNAAVWWNSHISAQTWHYQLVFGVLIFAFTFFYTSITFNPIEISKNVQNNGGMIPGIRQGKPTVDFIKRISTRVTTFGAIYLAVLAIIPSIIYAIAGVYLPFTASSLLIAVSVAMETVRQLESQMLMRHYKGFLK